MGRAGIDASKQVVAYDQNNGMWASRLWWLLHWLGHEAAAVLDGGIDKWIAEGRRADAPIRRASVRRDSSRSAPRPVVSSDDILRISANTHRGRSRYSTRAHAERYRGDIEPLDPVAGHIPGAINRPYGANLTPQRNIQAGGAAARGIRGAAGDHAAVARSCTSAARA